jgi:hypothetical protein
MPGNCDRFALHGIQQLSKTVLRLYRGHSNHRFHLDKLANMDNIAKLANLQQVHPNQSVPRRFL